MSVYEAAGVEAQAIAGYPYEPPDRVFVMRRADGAEWAITHWTQAEVTWNFEGVTLQITLPGTDPVVAYLTVLTTDILVYRDQVFIHRLRVVDASDVFDAENHMLTLIAVDYGQLLRRRVLFHDREIDKDQFDAAWDLIAYTQTYESFGITRGTTGTSGQNRERVLQRGQTISDAINEMARNDNGFDWWVDRDLKFWMQNPRRLRNLDIEWKWGVEVREISRTGAASEYASVVFVIGATSDTEINGKTYPPPVPVPQAATSMPYGRWERTYSYTDVVTASALLTKGNFHLKDLTAMRATYAITIEPNVWQPLEITIGDLFWLRIESPPRMNVRSQVRIEEIKISLTTESEVVTMSVRSEQPEEVIPSPVQEAVAAMALIEPLTGPAEEIYVDVSALQHGASVILHPLDPAWRMARLLTGFNTRMERLERSKGSSGGGGAGGVEEVFIGDQVDAEPTSYKLWYDPNA